jgi:hypothetical protein
MPNNFSFTRSFAGRRCADLPVRRNLVFDPDLLAPLAGEILARCHVGLAADVAAEADSASIENELAQTKAI